MMKIVIIGQKVVFCGSEKTMMPTESSWDLFTKGLRVVRPSIAESFSPLLKVTVNVGDFRWNYPAVSREN